MRPSNETARKTIVIQSFSADSQRKDSPAGLLLKIKAMAR
jgi:hypothetical protein